MFAAILACYDIQVLNSALSWWVFTLPILLDIVIIARIGDSVKS